MLAAGLHGELPQINVVYHKRMRTLIIILLGLGSLVSAWVILVIIFFGNAEQGSISLPESQGDGVTSLAPVSGKQVITTWANDEFSAVPLIEHADTTELDPGVFYKNSSTPELYGIYYDDLSSSVTVLLAGTPLQLARTLAEAQLQQVLRLPAEELCSLRITVQVNAAVNDEFSRMGNLGLSVCPGAVQLP